MYTIEAFIQMGPVRRETTIEIADEHYQRILENANCGADVEMALEEFVLDWLHAQYGWGWSGAGFKNDFSFLEGADGGGRRDLVVTSDSSIPNTVTKLSTWRQGLDIAPAADD